MADLGPVPITRRWAPRDPTVLKLFSETTPNGFKVAIMLEETGLPYEAHRVTLSKSDVTSPEFLSLDPNGKIPAIIDPNGPGGAPLGLFESGASLLCLGEKTGMLLGGGAAQKARVTQWPTFQMSGLGPMLRQPGFFVKFAGSEWEDTCPRDRHAVEARRLLAVLSRELSKPDWIAGDYSAADIAIAPWLNALTCYRAKEVVGWDDHPALKAYLDRFVDGDAVARGMNIPLQEG